MADQYIDVNKLVDEYEKQEDNENIGTLLDHTPKEE